MGLFDFFSSGAQQQPQVQQPPQPQNQHQNAPGQIPMQAGQAGANQVTAPNGAIPPEGTNPTPQNPLDQFADVWKPQTNTPQPSFAADPAKIMEIAKQADFRNAVTTDQMALVAQGGEAGVKAMMDIINSMSQASYGQAAAASAALVQKAIEQERANFAQQLPTLMKRNNVSENIAAQNPSLNHPAAQPLVKSLTGSLTQQYPNASAQEIQQMVGQYFTNLSQAFQPPSAQSQTTAQGTDWEAFFQS